MESSREYPRYAVVGVGAVVVKDGKVLLIKRGYPPAKGMWAIPGGVVEAGERLAEAVVRELEEETGLRGRPAGVIHVDEVIVREGSSVKYHYVLLDFLIDDVAGIPRPGGDAVEVSWFNLCEIPERDDVTSATKRLARRLIDLKGRYIALPLP